MRLFAVIAIGVLALLLPQSSRAASFDCTKARSPLEHAICNHPNLSQADEALATAYETALGGLSPAAKAKLQASQKSWLARIESGPISDTSPSGQVYIPQQVDGLFRAFQDRESILEQSRMMGGLRLTFVDHDEFARDNPLGDFSPTMAENYVAYSQIDGTGPDAAKFNALVVSSLRNDNNNDPPNGKDSSETLWVTAVDDTSITLTDTDWAMNHGAAHGDYSITYVHYLRNEGRLLRADDLFTKAGWQDRLGKLVVDALVVSYGSDFVTTPEAQFTIREGSIEPSHWNILLQGLLVQFSPEEFAPLVFGAPSVVIPWSVIRDDLNQGIGASLCLC